MTDKALSMSLDDYIKTQKKGNPKQQQQPGSRARVKGPGAGQGVPRVNVGRNLSNKHKTRYFQSGGGGGGAGRVRGGNPNAKGNSRTAVNGRKIGGRLNRPTLGGSRNGNIINNNGGTGKRGSSGLQFKRINNRLNVGGRIRPKIRIPQRTNRLHTSQPSPRLNQRAQRFGTNGNRNQNLALASTRNSNQGGLLSAGNRNRNQQSRKNWTRGLNRNRVLSGGVPVRPRNSLTMINPKPNIRVRNKRVQQLIQKRIQRARVTLARKTVNRSNNNLRIAPALLTRRAGGGGGSRPGSLITGNPRIRISKAQRALAQQKLNRARQTRARNVNTQRNKGERPSRRQNNRGLILDRNNLVKVRVANDFRSRNMPNYRSSVYHHHQHELPSSSSGSFGPGPYPLMSVSRGYPEHGHSHGGRGAPDLAMSYPDDFPPFVLSNNLSRDHHNGMTMDSAHQSLNPDIQRKISIIQNRAQHSRGQLDILPDFKGPVSTCKVNPGDRFRMMMN